MCEVIVVTYRVHLLLHVISYFVFCVYI